MMSQLCVFISTFLFFTASAHAVKTSEISGIRLGADAISRDYETKLLLLEGNVEIGLDQQLIRADKAEVNLKTRDVKAKGNVIILNKETYIEGSEVSYNLNTGLALIKSGFVQNGQVAFEGSIVKKTGDQNYYAEDATYTACLTCPPAWSFSGKTIEAEMGGYAYIKYPVLRVGSFPVLILPRLLVPLKTARQSGLLVPSLSFSEKGGAAISQSYFWAIDKSQDMTFTLRKYEKRGLKTAIEHRYLLSRNSRGTLRGAYIEDKSFTIDGQPSGTLETLSRSYLHYDHHLELPDDYVQRLELNYVTDLRYVRDFSDDLEGMHGEPALTNNVSLAKNTDETHASIDASFYINLIQFEDSANAQGDALSRNDDAVHRWPEIRYNITEQELGDSNLFWRLDFDYSHFVRRDFSYDDVTGVDTNRRATTVRDGSFDPTQDLIRTGHRTIIEPTLTYPMQLGKLIDVLPSVSYSESQYRFTAAPDTPFDRYQQNASLRYLRTDVGLRTIFSGVYGGADSLATRYKHEIIPEIVYSEIPWIERPDHVFFGNFENQPYSRSNANVTTNDFFDSVNNGLQFDYKDRIFDKKIVFFGITNTLTQKYFTPSGPQYSRFINFRVGQSYDFNEAKRETPNPWSAITSLLEAKFNKFETFTTADSYPYAKITNWSSRARFKFLNKNFVELQYSRKVTIDEDNNPILSTKTENIGLSMGLSSKYADFKGTSDYSALTYEFKGWEYIAILKPPGDCWNIKFGHKKTAGSDIESIVSFNFEFGGV